MSNQLTNPLSGRGTTGTVTKWVNPTTIGDSILTDSGTAISSSGPIRATGTSATAPAFTGSDTDTGVYFPAANQIRNATSGTLAIAVDASQNVGIGTASPASRLDVAGTITCDDAATGLKLPATPGNADAQTLDAYNQNTSWSPTVTWGTGGTVTTTSSTGAYTQIGNVITFTVTIAYSCTVVPTGGSVAIDLPRASASGFNQRPGMWAFNSFNGSAGTNFLSIGSASSTANLRVATATGTADIAVNLTVTGSGALVVTATYLAS